MSKKVYLFDENQKLINEFDSIKTLSEVLNATYVNINAAIRNKGFLLKKFYVSFEKELVLEKRKREMNPKIRGYSTVYEYKKHYVNSSEIRRKKYLEVQRNYDKNGRKRIPKKTKKEKFEEKIKFIREVLIPLGITNRRILDDYNKNLIPNAPKRKGLQTYLIKTSEFFTNWEDIFQL